MVTMTLYLYQKNPQIQIGGFLITDPQSEHNIHKILILCCFNDGPSLNQYKDWLVYCVHGE